MKSRKEERKAPLEPRTFTELIVESYGVISLLYWNRPPRRIDLFAPALLGLSA
jgi:hypothetical protein